MTLELKLSSMGFSCWLDQNATSITKDAMREGVASSRIFLLFLSAGVLTRPFCQFEIETALRLKKKVQLMHETDARHGAFHFAEADDAPPAIANLTLTHESLPWRRRRFEQDSILSELVKTSGLDAPRDGVVTDGPGRGGGGGGADNGGAASGDKTPSGSGLAKLPDTVPALPDTYSPRQGEQEQLLEVLLSRAAEAEGKAKVAAHGMGGLGKTTLAASVVRDLAVRKHFARIGFVSAGQEPATLALQRDLHKMLAGSAMEVKVDASIESQREALEEAAAGKRWLVVLDDLWTAEHEQQLNFVDEDESPECRVLVTTRFAKLFSGGYVEVPLGLLGEAAAVKLLLGTAEVVDPTAGQAAAAKTLAKMAGFLPLYVAMVGRLVYEFGTDEPWETEVVAMLEEDKGAVLVGSDGDSDSLGARVVGSSLTQVRDPDAVALFKYLAVAAEDVAIPMAALELIWCAHRELEPPLSRLQKMKLRKHAFALLDRNLVLGETTAGIFMHDVVREYSRAVVGLDALRGRQLRMVAMVLAATPRPGGWDPLDTTGKLNVFVVQSLRHSMVEAIGDDPSVGLPWLAPAGTSFAGQDFAALCAATSLGSAALTEAAAAAKAAGRLQAYARRTAWSICAWTLEQLAEGPIEGVLWLDKSVVMIKAFEEADAGETGQESGSDSAAHRQTWRTEQASLIDTAFSTNSSAMQDPSFFNHPEFGVFGSKCSELVRQDLDEPTKAEEGRAVALLAAAALFMVSGTMPVSLGSHAIESDQRDSAMLLCTVLRVGSQAAWLFSPDDPRRWITLARPNALGGMCWAGTFAFSDVLDETLQIATPSFCRQVAAEFSFQEHSAKAAAGTGGIDITLQNSMHHPFAVQLDLATARAWVGRLGGFFDDEFDIAENTFALFGWGHLALAHASACTRLAGLGPAMAKILRATGWTEAGHRDNVEVIAPIFAGFAARRGGFSCVCADYIADGARLNIFMLMPEDVDTAEFVAWLPPVGRVGSPRDDLDVVEVLLITWNGFCNIDSEPEARERLGFYGDAIEAGRLWGERFPFHPYFEMVSRLPMARSELALGRRDHAAACFVAAINKARAHRMPLLELVAHREYVVHCLDTEPGRRDEQLPLLGRVLHEQTPYHGGELGLLTALLGHSLDAAGCVASFEAIKAGGVVLPGVLPVPVAVSAEQGRESERALTEVPAAAAEVVPAAAEAVVPEALGAAASAPQPAPAHSGAEATAGARTDGDAGSGESWLATVPTDGVVPDPLPWHFLNAEFDCSAGAMDRLLNAQQSDLVDAINEQDKVTDYVAAPWVDGTRQVTMVFPKSAVGPAAAATRNDRYVLARPGELYVVETELHAPKMPYGDKWYAKGRNVVEAVQGAPNKCRLSVSSQLVFVKKVVIRKILEAGFKKEAKKSMKTFQAKIRELI